MKKNRRKFIQQSGKIGVGLAMMGGLTGLYSCADGNKSKPTKTEPTVNVQNKNELFFKISLAQWSLHRTFFDGRLDHLDFAEKAKKGFNIDGIEYVNQFFKDKATDKDYLNQMNQRAADNDVKQLLIMIDGEGNLGDPDDAKRKEAIENHYKWVEAAKHLGCHSIRVNAYGEADKEPVSAAAIDALGSLSTFAKDFDINVIVENHGSWSSDGKWLANVMKKVNLDNCGTLPDFGNFCIKRKTGELYSGECIDEYDKYKGVKEMMPFAKAVSAKANVFDADGNEPNIDFRQMMSIVKEHGYKGYVGIEYEGDGMSEDDGIKATKKLLEKVGKELNG